jgi:serine/threonine protein kinase
VSKIYDLHSETMYSKTSLDRDVTTRGEDVIGRPIESATWESGEIMKWDNNEYISSNTIDYRQSCDDDVDSCDSSPVRNPIHCFRFQSPSNESSVATCVNASSEVHELPVYFEQKPRLTLSAFRRPEQTIRLTHADPKRRLEMEYDLQAPTCGVLGHGAFSTVRLAVRRSDGLKVAIKSIAKHEALRSRRLRLGGRSYLEEWEILRLLQDNPYVISLLDVLESDEEIQLVTEFCKGGELFDAIQKKRNKASSRRRGQYSESQAAVITSQILSALADMHMKNIVHRDVKPENILLANDDDSMLHVKLCDFGVARPLGCVHENQSTTSNNDSCSDGEASPLTPGRARSFSTIGTDFYAAPEIVYGGAYHAGADIYSLGVTLYILLCGFPPVFSGEDDDEVIFPTSYWSEVSDSAKELLRKMLHPDSNLRVTAKDALKDNWIRERGIGSDVSGRRDRTLPSCVTSNSADAAQRKRQLDLDLVRSQLMLAMDSLHSDSPSISERSLKTDSSFDCAAANRICRDAILSTSPTPSKRARFERRVSSTFLALADLYRGVNLTQSGRVDAEVHVESSTPLFIDPSDELAVEQHEHSMKLAALSF